jgi:hypothetical protein
MPPHSPASLVTVYSTPIPFDAELVKKILTDEGITSFVEDTNAPFAGLAATPCHVLVELEHVPRARSLIEQHETRHRQTLAREVTVDSEVRGQGQFSRQNDE